MLKELESTKIKIPIVVLANHLMQRTSIPQFFRCWDMIGTKSNVIETPRSRKLHTWGKTKSLHNLLPLPMLFTQRGDENDQHCLQIHILQRLERMTTETRHSGRSSQGFLATGCLWREEYRMIDTASLEFMREESGGWRTNL